MATHTNGLLAYCAVHAPANARWIVPLTRREKIHGWFLFFRSLAVLFVGVFLLAGAVIFLAEGSAVRAVSDVIRQLAGTQLVSPAARTEPPPPRLPVVIDAAPRPRVDTCPGAPAPIRTPAAQALSIRVITPDKQTADLVAYTVDRLPTAWRSATRGVGNLRVVEENADIDLRILNRAGVSVYQRQTCGDVLVEHWIEFYLQGRTGEQTADNGLVSTILHELGHIWCCRGPGAENGHWTTVEIEPGVEERNRLGLMHHQMNCNAFQFGTLCPDRFSTRELRLMGLIR